MCVNTSDKHVDQRRTVLRLGMGSVCMQYQLTITLPCRDTARAAYTAVDLPDAVVDILTSLRNYLQDKCEPPVYVSDRRFMKSVNLLQVAAYADGRDQVHNPSSDHPTQPQCTFPFCLGVLILLS